MPTGLPQPNINRVSSRIITDLHEAPLQHFLIFDVRYTDYG